MTDICGTCLGANSDCECYCHTCGWKHIFCDCKEKKMTNLYPQSDAEDLRDLQSSYSSLYKKWETASEKLGELSLENKRLKIQILQQELKDEENENTKSRCS